MSLKGNETSTLGIIEDFQSGGETGKACSQIVSEMFVQWDGGDCVCEGSQVSILLKETCALYLWAMGNYGRCYPF